MLKTVTARLQSHTGRLQCRPVPPGPLGSPLTLPRGSHLRRRLGSWTTPHSRCRSSRPHPLSLSSPRGPLLPCGFLLLAHPGRRGRAPSSRSPSPAWLPGAPLRPSRGDNPLLSPRGRGGEQPLCSPELPARRPTSGLHRCAGAGRPLLSPSFLLSFRTFLATADRLFHVTSGSAHQVI